MIHLRCWFWLESIIQRFQSETIRHGLPELCRSPSATSRLSCRGCMAYHKCFPEARRQGRSHSCSLLLHPKTSLFSWTREAWNKTPVASSGKRPRFWQNWSRLIPRHDYQPFTTWWPAVYTLGFLVDLKPVIRRSPWKIIMISKSPWVSIFQWSHFRWFRIPSGYVKTAIENDH